MVLILCDVRVGRQKLFIRFFTSFRQDLGFSPNLLSLQTLVHLHPQRWVASDEHDVRLWPSCRPRTARVSRLHLSGQ